MLSNRDLSKCRWLLLMIITVAFFTSTSGAENQTEVKVEPNDESDDTSTELEVKEEPYTSVWNIMYDWWNWMTGGYAYNKNAVGEPRTFGAIRRLQMALIPIAFKFGVMFAMITALVFLAMKAVFLLKILLAMNAAAIFAKLILAKSEHHYQPGPPSWGGYQGWSHGPSPSWPIESPLNKEVHLHIHGSNLGNHPSWQRSDYGNSGNGIDIDSGNELNNRGPLPYLRSSQNQPNTYYVNGSG